MENRKEALRVRAEYALWSGRKAVHQPRLKSLQSKYILEQDDVNRMQRGLFSKLKRNYEEKLEQEQAEVDAAKAEWEKMTALMKEADEKLPALELQVKAFEEFWQVVDTSALYGEEKAVFDWCVQAEKCVKISREANLCLVKLKEAQMDFAAAREDKSDLLVLQKQVDLVWMNAEKFIQGLNEERAHSLAFLEEEDPMLVKAAKVYPCRLTRSLASFDVVSEIMKTNSSLHGMEEELQELRKQLSDVFEEMVADGEKLLQRMGSGESHFCEKDTAEVQAMPAEEEVVSAANIFEGVGLFGKVDLSKEKERVLFGLDLLKKEFEKITPENDRLNGWERAFWEWQQDLKQYRKNAGSFPCALDTYEILEKKTWQYTEEDTAELQRVYRKHLKETAEKLKRAEGQIRAHER